MTYNFFHLTILSNIIFTAQLSTSASRLRTGTLWDSSAAGLQDTRWRSPDHKLRHQDSPPTNCLYLRSTSSFVISIHPHISFLTWCILAKQYLIDGSAMSQYVTRICSYVIRIWKDLKAEKS